MGCSENVVELLDESPLVTVHGVSTASLVGVWKWVVGGCWVCGVSACCWVLRQHPHGVGGVSGPGPAVIYTVLRWQGWWVAGWVVRVGV